MYLGPTHDCLELLEQVAVLRKSLLVDTNFVYSLYALGQN